MSFSPLPSRSRIVAMVKAASETSGLSINDISFGRFRAAVEARHGIWRELRSLEFSYSAIGRSWGVDHTTVYVAINGRSPRPEPVSVAA